MDDKKLVTTEIISETNEAPLDLNAPISVHIHKMKPADWRDEAVEDYLNCALCGTELTFTHVTHFVDLVVEEEAYCSCCNIRAKKNAYRLQ